MPPTESSSVSVNIFKALSRKPTYTMGWIRLPLDKFSKDLTKYLGHTMVGHARKSANLVFIIFNYEELRPVITLFSSVLLYQ